MLTNERRVPEWIRRFVLDLAEAYHQCSMESIDDAMQDSVGYFQGLIYAAAMACPDTIWSVEEPPQHIIAWAVRIVQDEVWEWEKTDGDSELVLYLHPQGVAETWIQDRQ
jgi:hypothetical protein